MSEASEGEIDLRALEAVASLRVRVGARIDSCLVCGSREIVAEYQHREKPDVRMAFCLEHNRKVIEYSGAALWTASWRK